MLGWKIETRLKQIIGEVVDEVGGELIEVEVMADHVRLWMEVPPTVPMSKLVQKLKGRSSHDLGAEFPNLRRLPALWSPSWFLSTVGGAPLEVARRYVENQKLTANSRCELVRGRSGSQTRSDGGQWRRDHPNRQKIH